MPDTVLRILSGRCLTIAGAGAVQKPKMGWGYQFNFIIKLAFCKLSRGSDPKTAIAVLAKCQVPEGGQVVGKVLSLWTLI